MDKKKEFALLSEEVKPEKHVDGQKPDAGGSGNTDLKTAAWLSLLDGNKKRNEKLDEENKNLRQDREQRKYLSYALFFFMCFYMIAALAFVALCGFDVMQLGDSVLCVMLTTTLADVIGVFSFVAKYLYHSK